MGFYAMFESSVKVQKCPFMKIAVQNYDSLIDGGTKLTTQHKIDLHIQTAVKDLQIAKG